MPKFDVCVKAVVNVKVVGIEAADDRQAIALAKESVDFNALFNRAGHDISKFGKTSTEIEIGYVEFGDEFTAFLVDPYGLDGEPDLDSGVWRGSIGELIDDLPFNPFEYEAEDLNIEAIQELLTYARQRGGV